MKGVLLIVLGFFMLVEAAHLTYHRDNCAKPQIFDKNF